MSKQVFLTREDILKSDDIKKSEVSVPEWGGNLHVRMMSGIERDRYENLEFGPGEALSALVALTACDESGKLLFSVEDVKALGEKSSKALMRVGAASRKLNQLSLADIEELEKK